MLLPLEGLDLDDVNVTLRPQLFYQGVREQQERQNGHRPDSPLTLTLRNCTDGGSVWLPYPAGPWMLSAIALVKKQKR